jgi:hypothetical protein
MRLIVVGCHRVRRMLLSPEGGPDASLRGVRVLRAARRGAHLRERPCGAVFGVQPAVGRARRRGQAQRAGADRPFGKGVGTPRARALSAVQEGRWHPSRTRSFGRSVTQARALARVAVPGLRGGCAQLHGGRRGPQALLVAGVLRRGGRGRKAGRLGEQAHGRRAARGCSLPEVPRQIETSWRRDDSWDDVREVGRRAVISPRSAQRVHVAAVPPRFGARRPAGEILQSELA